MFPRLSFALAVAAASLISVPAHASDLIYPGGGTMAQIVDGGGTRSTLTLINLDSTSATYTLSFYADDGSALTLSTTSTTAGSTSSAVLTGTLPVGGSTIIQTSGSGGAIVQGYAVLLTDFQIGGSVVFGLPLAHLPLAEASCPLDTGLASIIGIPFDQTTASYGVALVNSPGDDPYQAAGGKATNLAISFYDQTGNQIGTTQAMQLAHGQHTAFMLDNQFPPTAGKTGVMVITSTDTSGNAYAIKVLGLRANLAGTTFTSVAPLIPCNYDSSFGGCTQF